MDTKIRTSIGPLCKPVYCGSNHGAFVMLLNEAVLLGFGLIHGPLSTPQIRNRIFVVERGCKQARCQQVGQEEGGFFARAETTENLLKPCLDNGHDLTKGMHKSQNLSGGIYPHR